MAIASAYDLSINAAFHSRVWNGRPSLHHGVEVAVRLFVISVFFICASISIRNGRLVIYDQDDYYSLHSLKNNNAEVLAKQTRLCGCWIHLTGTQVVGGLLCAGPFRQIDDTTDIATVTGQPMRSV